jgi:hypothetical protein
VEANISLSVDADGRRMLYACLADKHFGDSDLSIRRLVTTRIILILAAFIASVSTVTTYAQDTFLIRWQARASATQALQPKWIVPVVSPYPTLIQVFRTEFTRQISPTHVDIWNLGSSRGLNLIPFARTEFDIFVPPFFQHSDTTRDGFGDLSTSAKFRVASGNEKHGNYSVAAILVATVPTGSYKNGGLDASINPAISGGKGWGKFDMAATVGGTLPTGDTQTIGRTVATNAYGQYHVAKYLWPELEMNSTAFYGGTHDGKIQTFLTPGLMTGKFALHQDAHARAGFAAGIAFQTSVTQFHTFNHGLVVTSRFIF